MGLKFETKWTVFLRLAVDSPARQTLHIAIEPNLSLNPVKLDWLQTSSDVIFADTIWGYGKERFSSWITPHLHACKRGHRGGGLRIERRVKKRKGLKNSSSHHGYFPYFQECNSDVTTYGSWMTRSENDLGASEATDWIDHKTIGLHYLENLSLTYQNLNFISSVYKAVKMYNYKQETKFLSIRSDMMSNSKLENYP